MKTKNFKVFPWKYVDGYTLEGETIGYVVAKDENDAKQLLNHWGDNFGAKEINDSLISQLLSYYESEINETQKLINQLVKML